MFSDEIRTNDLGSKDASFEVRTSLISKTEEGRMDKQADTTKIQCVFENAQFRPPALMIRRFVSLPFIRKVL